MRWLFADPHIQKEAAYVREVVARIDGWWHAFQAKASDLDALFKRKSDWNLPQFMEDTLQAIDPRLMWEFGPALRGPGHRLVITPESERWLRPIVRTILERAPKTAEWEFYPYRPAETARDTIQTVQSRVGPDITGALVEASIAPGRKVNLHYAFPGSQLDQDTAVHAALVATESLMGEQVLDTWIGEIGLIEPDRPSGRALPLERAQATVAALIRSAIEQLPAVRRHELPETGQWATLKLEPPEPAEDYSGRGDLVVAATREVELFQAIHSGQPFSSSCHSRLGETFCYLKLDADHVPTSDIVAFRAEFEDYLQPALASAGLGCVIGGGSGLRYAYIDLALADLKRAAPIVRRVLSEQHAPLRSWLLFNDDDYAQEWLGAYPETPPPPPS